MKDKKQIYNCCLACGKKFGTKHKKVFGMWKGTCDMCNKKDIFCAAAGHDFGIYNNEKEKFADKIQDKL